MTKDEALKLAHEALKKFHYAMIDAGVLDRQEVLNEGFTAATAIKEALAQPEQEPVAWLEPEWGEKICPEIGYEVTMTEDHPRDLGWIPLTPPQRTWVGLTDRDVDGLVEQYWDNDNMTVRSMMRAIEAKLKEKNT